MTTEEGLPNAKFARHNIHVLQDRRDYLQRKHEELHDDDRHGACSYAWSELRALEWALPVLEAEWASIIRMQREYARTPPDSAASITVKKERSDA